MDETPTSREAKPRFYTLFEYKDNILSQLCTDVPTYLESELKELVLQKLSKNAVYTDVGSVTQFDISNEEKIETWSCYYCMVRGKEIRDDGCNMQYVVCFLALESEMLENFTHDLDIYCSKLTKEIDNTKDNQATVKCYLEKWYETTLDFLCRCVHLLQQDIKFILYCALVDGCLMIEGGTEAVCSDLKRFVSMCNMSDIFGSESMGSMDMLVDISSTKPQETVSLIFDNGEPHFKTTNCTKFCEHWSKAINLVDSNNPGEIRQAVEAFKVKYIHSINTLKRLLMEAETDYYAYYRAYKFMKISGNSEILLNHAHLDDITEVKGVFTDLKKYLVQTS